MYTEVESVAILLGDVWYNRSFILVGMFTTQSAICKV